MELVEYLFRKCKIISIVHEFLRNLFQRVKKEICEKFDLGRQENASANNTSKQSTLVSNENFILKQNDYLNYNIDRNCNANVSSSSIGFDDNKEDCSMNYEKSNRMNFQNKILYFRTLNEINQKISKNFYFKCGDNLFPRPIPENNK